MIRMLFVWVRDEGISIRQATKRLNASAYRPRGGRDQWSSVRAILINQAYTGNTYYNRRRWIESDRTDRLFRKYHKTRSVQRPREEWIPVPIPTLIDEEDFARVQQQLENNSGFSLDASIRIPAELRNSLEDLLLYMYRHPFTMSGIHYDPISKSVHYHAAKKHLGRNTDVISTDAVEFIAWLSQHIPHARRHQVRYYGACTPEVRKRLGLVKAPLKLKIPARTTVRGRKSWARQIWKQLRHRSTDM